MQRAFLIVSLIVVCWGFPASAGAQTALPMRPVDTPEMIEMAKAYVADNTSFLQSVNEGEAKFPEDVWYAKFDINGDGVDEIFMAMTDLWSCASMYGCHLAVFQRQIHVQGNIIPGHRRIRDQHGEIWIDISAAQTMVNVNADDIKILDATDNGYRRFRSGGRLQKWRGPEDPIYINDWSFENEKG